MVDDSVRAPAKRARNGKRPGRRSRGVALSERDGNWHASGSIRIANSTIRVRRSLGLAVASVTQDEAENALEEYIADLKAKATGKVTRGDPVAVAVRGYLGFKRKRPLGASSVDIAKEIVLKFGTKRLNEIPETDWKKWVDGEQTAVGFVPGRMTKRSAETRERFVSGVLAVLNYGRRHHGLKAKPVFERDSEARNPNTRKRRRIEELRPDLVQILFDHCHITIRAQLAVERCTGARVSSVIYAARVCDLILTKGREQLTFPQTKNGEDVAAVLDGTAIRVLREYLKWRGNLHEREAPLFLTYKRKPYTFNNRAYGGQNKTGFRAAKRRAAKIIRDAGEIEYRRLKQLGQRKVAAEVREQANADAALLESVTQHWFRHMVATKLVRLDPRAAMEQGGWLDYRSVMAYAHDAPAHRRQLVNDMDQIAPARKHSKARKH
jgi:integrase-like protein